MRQRCCLLLLLLLLTTACTLFASEDANSTRVTPSAGPFASEEATSTRATPTPFTSEDATSTEEGRQDAGVPSPPHLVTLSPGHPVTPSPPPPLGVHLLLDDGRNQWPTELWPEHMRYARDVTGRYGYVTELIRLDDLDLERWQLFMDLCTELELSPILRLATTFDQANNWWRAPVADSDGRYRTLAGRYANFVAGLAWPPGRPHTIIVGNEPNHGNEWSGRPDPAAYAQFLIDVAQAMRAADPAVQILNAGFDPYTTHTGGQPFVDGMLYLDAETFMDQMVAAHPDVFSHLDAWASHPYPLGPLTAGPWLQTYGRDMINGATNPAHVPPPDGVFNRGINGYEWELFKLATYGITDLPVMITETGWRHAESTDPAATDNGRPLPSAQTVAEYYDLAFFGNHGRYPQYPQNGWTPWLEDPRVLAVTPFAFNGYPAEWGHTNWLELDGTGRVLGTYAIYDWAAGVTR